MALEALAALDAAAVHRWGRAALASLEEHRAEIDRLNVFPIPDGDTGTNLTLTVRAAVAALDGAPDGEVPGPASQGMDGPAALAAFARGAVLGARGNSGVIVSQLLRALADAAAERPACDAGMLRLGLQRGAVEARTAVAVPVEGTILTVASAAADALDDLPDGEATLRELAEAALRAAEQALLNTPDQLPVLARAGVVDAGAQGLVLMLDALSRTLGGRSGAADLMSAPGDGAAMTVHGSGGFGYEVQYLLDAPPGAAGRLRSRLAGLGDSVVVVGTGDGTWNVHAHVDDVGAALEAGVEAGRPHRISVVRFDDDEPADAAMPVAVIAVAPGPGADGVDGADATGDVTGLARLFESEGIGVVSDTDPTVDDVLAAIATAGARKVVLLPNATRIGRVAEAAAAQARAQGTRVAVVPTRSPVQGLAAIAVHDPSRRFDDDVVAMAEAAAATRFAEVTVAMHESLTSVGICQAGDILGLIDGEVVEIGHGVLAVALALVDRLLGVGAELMTVLVGAAAPAEIGAHVARHVRERSPLTEVTVYDVGQPRYPLIIGVE